MLRVASTVALGLVLTHSLCASERQFSVRRDTQFPVEFKHSIKAKNAKVGDTVEFRTVGAVLIGNNVVVPDNSVILATIVEVQHRSATSRRSLLRLKIHTVRWKDGEAPLNAIVTSVRPGRIQELELRWHRTLIPTFLEGIKIVSHQQRDADTEFYSDDKDFTLRGGVALLLRQIDPNAYPEREMVVYTPDGIKTAELK